MPAFRLLSLTCSLIIVSTPLIAVAVVMLIRRVTGSLRRLSLHSRRLSVKRGEAGWERLGSLPPIRAVYVIQTAADCARHMTKLMKNKPGFVGLDCEWVSTRGARNQVDLLQIATPQRVCYLFRLSKMHSVPTVLRDFLATSSILKFGVAIVNEDRHRLLAINGINLSGCVDLNHLNGYSGVGDDVVGLKRFSKSLLNVEMKKNHRVRTSNWAHCKLSADQITYAAWDALIALDIAAKLVERRMNSEQCSSDSGFKCFDWKDERSLSVLREMSQEFIDVRLRSAKRSSKIIQSVPLGSPVSSSLLLPASQPAAQQVLSAARSQPQRSKVYSLRRTPLYHNHMLLAPDGQHLSTIDKKKTEWYLKRDLADMVSEDPPVVKLRFMPAGRPGEDREYYLAEKENRCVVCGGDDSYVRKNVVPHEYRRHFPAGMKEHKSHDVLLLCVDCHQLSSQHDGSLRQALAWRYSAPLSSSMPASRQDPVLTRVKSHAKALLRGFNIPDERRQELKQSLMDFYESDNVTEEAMHQAAQMSTKVSVSDGCVSHGEVVADAVLKEGRLLAFQQEWRQHFLDTMNPRHLPKLWSVTHCPSTPV